MLCINKRLYSAVMWAYYNTPQVTNGKDESHFAPKASCTRAQVVTFLWRAAGRPAPSGSVQQFSDVPKTNSYAYCYDAILWAVENGITKGTDATHFSPNATVTRAQFVTFLWRYAGEPAPKNMSCGFNDVDAPTHFTTKRCSGPLKTALPPAKRQRSLRPVRPAPAAKSRHSCSARSARESLQ